MKRFYFIFWFCILSIECLSQITQGDDCGIPQPLLIVEEPTHCDPSEPTWIYVLFPELYQSIEWNAEAGEIVSQSLNADSILVSQGIFEIITTDFNGCISSEVVFVKPPSLSSIFSNGILCNATEICWIASSSNICHYFLLLEDSEFDGWEGAELEVVDEEGSTFFSLSDSESYEIHKIVVGNQTELQFRFHSGSDDTNISITILDNVGNLAFDSTLSGLSDENILNEVVNCEHEPIMGHWTCSYPQFEFQDSGEVDFLNHENCLFLEPNCIGECEVRFESISCNFKFTETVKFSTTPNLVVPDYSICYGGEVILEPYFDPEICYINSNEIPDTFCGGIQDCLAIQEGIYLLEFHNVCGSSQAESNVTMSDTNAGEVFINFNEDSHFVYLDDPVTYSANFSTNSTSLESYAYIITNSDNTIISITATAYDFSNNTIGVYYIWGVAYTGILEALPGEHISSVSSDECYHLSENQVIVYVENFNSTVELYQQTQSLNWKTSLHTLIIQNPSSDGLLNIYNSIGQIVHSSLICSLENRIDLSHLTHGMYYCIFRSKALTSTFKLYK